MPSPNKELIKKLSKADDNGLVCYACYLCEKILETNEFAPTLLIYASNLTSLARYDDANQVLDRAEAVIPPSKRQHLLAQRGHILEAKGNLSDAEEMYITAHKADPNDATYLIYAGSAAFQQGAIERAEQLARKATACSDGCIDEAYFNLGGYLISQLRYAEAHECYRKALVIDPDYNEAKLRLKDIDSLLKNMNE